MSNGDTGLVRLTIEFDPEVTPITGWLDLEQGPRQEFQGMLELVSLVEAVRRAARSGGEADPPGRR